MEVDTFFNALKEVSANQDSDSSFYVQMLIAVSEYPNFVQMMQSYKMGHD